MTEPNTGLSPLTEPVCGSSTDNPSIPLIDSSPVLPTPISSNEPMATVDGGDGVLGSKRQLQVYSRREAPAPKPVLVQDSDQASGAECYFKIEEMPVYFIFSSQCMVILWMQILKLSSYYVGDVFYANWDEVLVGATAVVSTLGGFGSDEQMQRINGEANVVAVGAAKDFGKGQSMINDTLVLILQ
ncbi:hypothetical protein EZV62_019460 [Acer yangbiense]|uniref:Uncharacterized protein n=1 Tax=Acer yangbiense TaxID=1000413 RepID=A0A5C7HB43_9ROSI|nr:hypothetical protein EZV62_019460 [Acer yangbiense]